MGHVKKNIIMKNQLFKLLTIVIIIINSNISFAQVKNWQIGLKVMPEWENFVNNSRPFLFQTLDYNKKFNVNGGAQVLKNLNRYFAIETGLYFTTKSTEIIIGQFNCPVCDLSYFLPIAYPPISKRLSYLNFPLILRFKLKGFYSGAGIGIDKFISQRSDPDYGIEKSDLNNWLFELPLSIGYQKKLYKSLNIFLEGRYTPTLSKIYKNSSEKAVNYGFGFGVNWTLNKK